MKKHLIQGALALGISATLISCHADEDLSYSVVDQKIQAYEQVFEEEFGKINPNQDWGFGQASAAARTRAIQAVLTRSLADNLPAQPSFRSKPSMPTFSTTVPDGTPKAVKSNWKDNGTFYIDNTCNSSDLENPQNQSGVTIYATGNNVTYPFATNQNGNGTKIIVTQNSTLTLTQVGNNLSIYLAPGATLNLPDGATFKKNGAMLYMGSGSTINVGGNHNLTFSEEYSIINNGGSFNSNTNLTVREAALMYNETDITVNNLNIEDCYSNVGGEIVNNATINATNVNMKAGGKLHNLGTMFVSNRTYITNDETTQWMNDGQYTTGDFYLYDCNRIYNNCKLTVTKTGTTGNGTFTLAESQFVLNGGATAGASAICDSFIFESNAGGQFHMGSKSLLKVSGTMLLKSSNYGYGFHGYGSDYAVIQANKIDKDTGGQYKAWYDGKLYIATDDHFAQGGTSSQPWIYSESNVIFKKDAASPVTIAATSCNPGYSGGGNPPHGGDDTLIPIVNETSYTRRTYKKYRYKTTLKEFGRIMCEDLGRVSASDIDFNDVVFDAYIYNMIPVYSTRITKIENGVETELQGWNSWSEDYENAGSAYLTTDIYLLAGGGTIPVTVAGVDVKNSFNTSHVMVVSTVDDRDNSDVKHYGNVYDNNQTFKQPAALKDIRYDASNEDRKISTLNDIKIVVKYGTSVYELKAYKGAAPHKICVPIRTKWPYERVEINKAYNFNDYVRTVTATDTTVTYNGSNMVEVRDAQNKVIGYYLNEKENNIWTATPTAEQENNRYQGNIQKQGDITGVPYSAREIGSLLERSSNDGLPADESYTDETVTISSGYNNQTDPVLVRRRD